MHKYPFSVNEVLLHASLLPLPLMAHFISNYIVVFSLLSANFNQLIASDVLQFPVVKHESSKKGGDDDDSVAFLVVGDWGRGGNFNQSKVANQMGEVGGKLDIDFVISTGDNFYDKGLKGTEDPFFRRSYTDIYTAESLQTPWYIVLGNHDYLGNTAAQLSPKLRKIDKRWRCMRNFIVMAGVADIFFIDTTPFVKKYFDNPKNQSFDWRGVLPRDQYMSYVRKNLDLALSKSSATWKIVVGHHTIKSIGHHGDTQDIVDQILPILEVHKVDMYINGHDHCLEHLSNKEGSMQFLTSGGGSKAWKNDINYGAHNNNTVHFYYDGQGFMSVKIKPEKAKIEFFDVLGKSLYRLKLK